MNDTCSPQEKVCVQAKKVFDACLKQMTNENVPIKVTNVNPPNAVAPLTFVSGRSLTSKGTVTNLTVERLEKRPKYGRVQCDVTVPVEVNFFDSNNVAGTGTGFFTVHEDVVLFLPEPSVIPYEVTAVVSVVCPNGFFSQTVAQAGETIHEFEVTACLSVILKIVMEAELILPSYGYAVIPPCQEFSEQVCSGFFEMPLFPSAEK